MFRLTSEIINDTVAMGENTSDWCMYNNTKYFSNNQWKTNTYLSAKKKMS